MSCGGFRSLLGSMRAIFSSASSICISEFLTSILSPNFIQPLIALFVWSLSFHSFSVLIFVTVELALLWLFLNRWISFGSWQVCLFVFLLVLTRILLGMSLTKHHLVFFRRVFFIWMCVYLRKEWVMYSCNQHAFHLFVFIYWHNITFFFNLHVIHII